MRNAIGTDAVAHAELRHHHAGDARGLFQVLLGAGEWLGR